MKVIFILYNKNDKRAMLFKHTESSCMHHLLKTTQNQNSSLNTLGVSGSSML